MNVQRLHLLPVTCTALLCLCSWGTSALADEPVTDKPAEAEQEQKGLPSLDDQLLEDLQGDLPAGLDDELFRGLTPLDGDSKNDKPIDPLEKTLLDPLNQGEDIGEEADPLLQLAKQMRIVTERIEQRDTGTRVQQAQKEIVDTLDKLIEQAQKACSSGNCNNPQQQQQASNNQQQQPKSGSATGNKPSDKPARDSTDREEKRKVEEIDLARMQDLVKLVWGHLPPHLQQQMQSSSGEKFLPKYQLLIEQYFKDLVEQQNNRP